LESNFFLDKKYPKSYFLAIIEKFRTSKTGCVLQRPAESSGLSCCKDFIKVRGGVL
jgi:hypothetical protein